MTKKQKFVLDMPPVISGPNSLGRFVQEREAEILGEKQTRKRLWDQIQRGLKNGSVKIVVDNSK